MFNYCTYAIVSCVVIIAIKVCYHVYCKILGRYHRNIPFPQHGQCDVDHVRHRRRFIWKYRWERFLRRVFNRSPRHPFVSNMRTIVSHQENGYFEWNHPGNHLPRRPPSPTTVAVDSLDD